MIVTTWIRTRAVLVLGMVLATLAGCGEDVQTGPTLPEISGSASATPTTSLEEDEARRQILAVYNGYLATYIKASATADYRTTELAAYVGEPLLGQLLNSMYIMSIDGVHNDGRPTWTPAVTELQLSDGQAVIEDCFDGTNWHAVGGKTPPPAQPKRYPVVVKAKRVNAKWYVYESTAYRGDPC
ncbi:hypothetical protein ACFFX1_08385 [Dactylosporangium sucinum]|uniref:Secreted protein n=1 Tax=Dactylosporangium sucinum TaxID=1424081 RepID=A0A917U248_9ACTN|nr:hypothetical protein [Dactylosporangium sucinum]GGM51812.1 hypothetical protein GCM10007977_061880 [Dactylosporangium sucinum]